MALGAGLLLLSVTCFILAHAVDIRLPPSIQKQGPQEHIYLGTTSFSLYCEASGYPTPTYEWKKDGELFDRISPTGDHGTLNFEEMTFFDKGAYQCIASNDYGVALSVVTRLVQASFQSGQATETTEYFGREGDSLTVPCPQFPSVPRATYSWDLAGPDNMKVDVRTTSRVTIGDNGDLHFAYLLSSDDRTDYVYKCVLFNALMYATAGPADSSVSVRSGTDDQGSNRPAEFMVATESPKVLLLHSNDSIKCFFKGKPAPEVTWARDNDALPRGRVEYEEFRSRLRITKVHWSDEGTYECTGRNSAGTSEPHRIEIDVQAVPEFLPGKSPLDMNVTEGETATFHCDVLAEPDAELQWLINGEALDNETPGHRRQISENRRSLTIREVCKDCETGPSDLMVIQCNASNVHGYTFSSGYLNVLKKTLIHTKPENQDWAGDSDEIAFNCGTTTDDSTDLLVRWYQNDQLIYLDQEQRMSVNASHSLLINVTDLDKDGVLRLTGDYRCNASNGNSWEGAAAKLTAQGETQEPLVVVAAFEWWWIAVAVAIFLLILIIIICCCICQERGQGDSYPVDEKERAEGHDPEKELTDLGYHDYSRPVATDRVKGSRASLASTVRIDNDDDEGVSHASRSTGGSLSSHDDYFDPGRFNEDGSFIGEYATDKRKK